MDSKDIEKAIIRIVDKKKQLNKIDYSDETYDTIEEELHDLEDDFTDKFGEDLEKALEEVHKKFNSDNDVLLPIAYLAGSYIKVGEAEDGSALYDVDPKQGVYVEVEKMPGKNTRLVIVPGPLRILLLGGTKDKEEVWKTDK